MDVPAESAGAAAGSASRGDGGRRLTLAVALVLLGALAVTLWRLRRGADLVDEAFSVLVPWRWALGDRPFVDEQNLSQAAGLLAYPFVKVFALVTGDQADGLVLFGRHLFLGLGLLTATVVFLLARRSLSTALALLVAAPFATVVLFETPQLTPNTLAALFLSIGAALGAVGVLGGPRRYCLWAGVAYGLAAVAYPTIALMAPFVGVLLAMSVGDRGVGFLAPSSLSPSGRPDRATGRRAWRAVSAWSLGGVAVLLPVVAVVIGLAGAQNLRRGWDYTLGVAAELDQLGGAAKAVDVAGSFVSLVAGEWYIVVAAVASLLVFRARPAGGRWLLLLTAPALWLTATTNGLHTAGAVIVYALSAPYLYLFLPHARREDGACLLVSVWAPALLLGAMTAYTSADGLERAAVGLFPGLVASGLFLAWGLQPLRFRPDGAPWPAAVGLAAVVLAFLAMQIQFQQHGVVAADVGARMSSGPWSGIAVTEGQKAYLTSVSADLERYGRPGDRLLVYPQGAAPYLYWPGEIAANTYQMYVPGPDAPLPKATVSYYRRHREAPTLVVNLRETGGRGVTELTTETGGLDYPPLVARPDYVLHRRPAGEGVEDALDRLPRLPAP